MGFAFKNSLLSMVKPGDKGSERLLTLRLQTSDGPVILVNAYAPTLNSTPEAKDEFNTNLSDEFYTNLSDEFYTNLSDVIKTIPVFWF